MAQFTRHQKFGVYVPLCAHGVPQGHQPSCLACKITLNRKAIDQRVDEGTKAALDKWHSDSHKNQKLTWP